MNFTLLSFDDIVAGYRNACDPKGGGLYHNHVMQCEFRVIEENVEKEYIVTLVHGTFALKASWTQPGSFLRSYLEHAVINAGSKITFEVFSWPGLFGTGLNNGHRYRTQAGRSLAKHIDSITKHNPKARQFIIGHSHGGNVAYYALNSRTLQEQVRGVVCLATPFINCMPRNFYGFSYHTVLMWLLYFAAVFIVPLIPAALLFFYFHTFLESLPEVLKYLLAFVAINVWAIFLITAIEQLSKWDDVLTDRLLHWMRVKQLEILERLRLPNIYGPHVFCAHTPGDEARWHLGALQFFAGVPTRFWTFWCYVLLFFGILIIGSYWPQWIPNLNSTRAHSSKLGPAFDNAILVAWLTVILFSLLHAIIIAVVPWLLRGHGLAFGQEGVLDNLLVRIEVGQVPTSGAVTSRSYRMKGFRHSAFYNDNRVLAEITDWILHSPPNQWTEWEAKYAEWKIKQPKESES